jgi:hypothetical protein
MTELKEAVKKIEKSPGKGNLNSELYKCTGYSSFYSRTVHLDIIEVFDLLMHKRIGLKRKLKFTLKQLQHVSVQSPSSGSALFELARVTVVKILN